MLLLQRVKIALIAPAKKDKARTKPLFQDGVFFISLKRECCLVGQETPGLNSPAHLTYKF